MRLENRLPDESVNYSIEHPLKEFAWLLAAVVGSILALAIVVGLMAGEIAARLPYRYEQIASARMFPADKLKQTLRPGDDIARERALAAFAERLVPHLPLPEGMSVQIHYQAGDVVNAYATLGGHIVIHAGLLRQLRDENALAMVLAHEMAHAALRHPVRSLGRGLALGVILTAFGIGDGGIAMRQLAGLAGDLPLLKFSRDQERAADALALAALAGLYGHVGGAHDTFKALAAAQPTDGAARAPPLAPIR